MSAGANILAPIAIGPKRLIGTAVDYAHYMFQQVSIKHTVVTYYINIKN